MKTAPKLKGNFEFRYRDSFPFRTRNSLLSDKELGV